MLEPSPHLRLASAFPMSCVDPLPPWTPALVALVQPLHFTPADYQNLPDLRAPARQIYALPRRLAPPIEQLGKFQIERDDNFLEQRSWILQQCERK